MRTFIDRTGLVACVSNELEQDREERVDSEGSIKLIDTMSCELITNIVKEQITYMRQF